MAWNRLRFARTTEALRAVTTYLLGEPIIPTDGPNANRLFLGDGATVGGNQIAMLSDIVQSAIVPSGRLTLTSGVAVTTADVAGAPTVYYTPAIGNRIPIYDGTNVVARSFAELSLPLDATTTDTGYHQSGRLFDFFVVNDNGTLRLGTGPAWSNATAGASARGVGSGTTEIEQFGGYWVNKQQITLRFGSATGNTLIVPARRATYVGTGCMTANGQIEDSRLRRYLWNAYNRVEKLIYYNTVTASYAYSTATLRQVEGSAGSQVNFVMGLPGDFVEAKTMHRFISSTATLQTVVSAVGLNQTTTANDVIHRFQDTASSSKFGHSWSEYRGTPPAGLNFLAWLEQGAGGDTQTMFSAAGLTGISGRVRV